VSSYSRICVSKAFYSFNRQKSGQSRDGGGRFRWIFDRIRNKKMARRLTNMANNVRS